MTNGRPHDRAGRASLVVLAVLACLAAGAPAAAQRAAPLAPPPPVQLPPVPPREQPPAVQPPVLQPPVLQPPVLQPPVVRPPAAQPAPAAVVPSLPQALDQALRSLVAGSVWLVQPGERPQALRVALEHGGRVVASVTLDPASGEPVAVERRDAQRPATSLSAARLAELAEGFRQRVGELRFGRFAVPSPAGLQVPVTWRDLVIAYVTVDPSTGALLPDAEATRELAAGRRRTP